MPPRAEFVGSIYLIGLYVLDNKPWDAKSDSLLARIIGMFSEGTLRAHSDQMYVRVQGAWRQEPKLPPAMVTGIEDAMARAQYLLLKLMDYRASATHCNLLPAADIHG